FHINISQKDQAPALCALPQGNTPATYMDPADAAPVLRELSIQGEMLERHEKMMKHVVEEQTVLRQLVAELKGILLTPPGAAADAPSPGPSLSTREHPLPAPEKFSGDLDKSCGFLTQCSFIFREQPRSYFSDGAKVGLMVESMTGRALQWAQAVVSMQPAISYEDFLCKFRCVFDKGSSIREERRHCLRKSYGHKRGARKGLSTMDYFGFASL
uniref:DUF4939 domain-containing protein n=1 Tax=Maylandia zebra TaxID=106582 RepID=A0A3P9BR34_9CICH